MERWGERGRKGGLKLTEEATTRVGLSDPTTARNTKHNSKSTHTHTHTHTDTHFTHTHRERERVTTQVILLCTHDVNSKPTKKICSLCP